MTRQNATKMLSPITVRRIQRCRRAPGSSTKWAMGCEGTSGPQGKGVTLPGAEKSGPAVGGVAHVGDVSDSIGLFGAVDTYDERAVAIHPQCLPDVNLAVTVNTNLTTHRGAS